MPAGGLTVTHPALASISGLHVGEGAPALTSGPGVYVGEGATPMPKKLADKILRWEFVEMGELLRSSGSAQGMTPRAAAVDPAR